MSLSASPIGRPGHQRAATQVTPTRTWVITFTPEPRALKRLGLASLGVDTTAADHTAVVAQIVDAVRERASAEVGERASVSVDPHTGWGHVFVAGHLVAQLTVAELTGGRR